MTKFLLSMAIRLTFYATIGVASLLVLGRFHVMSDYPLGAKATFVAAFAVGMYHGRLRRLRHKAQASRNVR